MIVANLLKISNSAMYGFSRQVKTVSDALKMLGLKMVINAVMCMTIGRHLKPDLSPYDIDIESFTANSSFQSAIIEQWTDAALRPIQSDLQFSAFLQEVGVIVISMVAIEKNLVQAFRQALERYDDQSMAEEAVFGLSSAEVTSIMFSEWKFNQKIIDYISGTANPEKAPESTSVGSRALKIAKMLAPIGKTSMSEESVSKARERAMAFGLDESAFEKMIGRITGKLG
jgi:HD-like signal output (HDOD) protein